MTREKLAADPLREAVRMFLLQLEPKDTLRGVVYVAKSPAIGALEAALDAPAQPVHRPAKLSGYSKDLRVESAQPVHPEPPLTDAAIAEQRWQARHAQPVHPEPLDVERLADAVLGNVAYDEDTPGRGLCRYCQNFYGQDGHSFDCVVVIARRLREASEPEGAKE